MPYALCFLIFVIGLYCAVVKKNMVKIVVGILVMEYAVNLFLIMLGFRWGGIAPIIDKQYIAEGSNITSAFLSGAVDPLPQALVLTAIVIGFGTEYGIIVTSDDDNKTAALSHIELCFCEDTTVDNWAYFPNRDSPNNAPGVEEVDVD